MPVPGWPDGASLTSQRGTGYARHCQVSLCTSLITPFPAAEHRTPTSTQATASSARASSSPPFAPPHK
ncbi:hypothetical protein FIBSPDRAFT_869823 [Athelia psychrophila]|uniref:Uncharacterized protein n=1 Tax=Athelia psychrophila TaxID=1759441 RepID=A0A166BNZ2_9AGAM|nr:hypothetical protein FIBSPDRAFT_869823 [Fibularhizoctonia sp. CBS 109695]